MVLQTIDQIGKIAENSPTARFVADNTVGCRSSVIKSALISGGVGLIVGFLGGMWLRRNQKENLQEPQFVVNEAIDSSNFDPEIIPEVFQRPVEKPRQQKKFKVA